MHEAALRKAAILIDSLDAETAEGLLEKMPSGQAAQIREAANHLPPIDDDERERVIRDFFQRGGLPAHAEAATGENSRRSPPSLGNPNHSPLAYLLEAPADLLAEFLAVEHPQTISAVLAHLPPRRAAEILRVLPGELHGEVLARLSRIDTADPDVLADLHDELRRAVESQRLETSRRRNQFATVSAILQSADDPLRQEMLCCLRRTDPQLFDHLAIGSADVERPKADSLKFEPAAQSPPALTESSTTESSATMDPLDFDDLTELDDASLVKLFRAADGEVARLALTAANRELIDRILCRLPLRQAKQLSQQLELLCPTSLRDLEHARQQILQLAVEMAEEGAIHWPPARRFSVAA